MKNIVLKMRLLDKLNLFSKKKKKSIDDAVQEPKKQITFNEFYCKHRFLLRSGAVILFFTSFIVGDKICKFLGIDDEPAYYNTQPNNAVVPAPDFKAETLDGKIIKLSDYKGKAVLLQFWQEKYDLHKREISEIEKIRKTYPKDLQVIGIRVAKKNIEETKKLIQSKNIKYTQAICDERLAKYIEKAYGIYQYSANYIIDKKGRIRHKYVSISYLKEKIESIIKEKK